MSNTVTNTNSRRQFLKQCGVVSVGFMGLSALSRVEASQAVTTTGYGPLLPDPKRTVKLPAGFSYKIISRKGKVMTDGLLTPGKPDGMAAFPASDGRVILIRNHEIGAYSKTESPYGYFNELLNTVDSRKFYDYGRGVFPSLGGTTTLLYNPRTQAVESEFLSLAGTIRNCAGGPTPWNSWITCEENLQKADYAHEKNHGFCFEVPATEKPQLHAAVPLKGMGRFNHEAVAVDPKTGVVYLTEDRSDGLFYRYIPKEPGKLLAGGKLQALVIVDGENIDVRNWPKQSADKLTIGENVDVRWVDIDNVLAPDDDLRFQGFEKGATRFARGEGIWFGNGELYFVATKGGKIQKGQVFRYTPSEHEGLVALEKKVPPKLQLFVETHNKNDLNRGDNITIAPWGDLVICEDDKHPRIIGVTPEGKFYKIAENIRYESEFAGGTFSPDGSTLFVNIQHGGITLAITGPWQNRQ